MKEAAAMHKPLLGLHDGQGLQKFNIAYSRSGLVRKTGRVFCLIFSRSFERSDAKFRSFLAWFTRRARSPLASLVTCLVCMTGKEIPMLGSYDEQGVFVGIVAN